MVYLIGRPYYKYNKLLLIYIQNYQSIVTKTFHTIITTLKFAYKVNKLFFFVCILIVFLTGLTPVISSLLLGLIVNTLTDKTTFSHSLIIALVVGYIFIIFIKDIAREYMQTITAYLYRYDLAKFMVEKIISKLNEMDIQFFESSEFNDIKAKALETFEWRPSSLLLGIYNAMDSTLGTLFSGFALFLIYPIPSLILIISIIPSVIADYVYKSGMWDIWESDVQTRRKYGFLLYLSQDKDYIKDLRLLNVGNYFKEMLLSFISKTYSNEKKIQVRRSNAIIITSLLPLFVAGFVILQLSNDVIGGIVSIGALTFFVDNIFTFRHEFGSALYHFSSLATESNYVSAIYDFLKIEPRVVSHPKAIKFIKLPPSIEFRNVSFRYPETEKFVIKNFNLEIQSGQKIALVGENGVGKSTLIKLLLRFYDVTQGEILINGINIKQLDLISWRNSVAALMQDFRIFEMLTIAESIGLGNHEKYQNEMLHKSRLVEGNDSKISDVPVDVLIASKEAKSHDFIMSNKKGYHEILGREFDGIDFSGGEKQRIALARTFYRNSGLIIMDEPTSAVDAKAESEIFSSIKEHLQDKTVIFVSHRFSTVRIADRIVVIDNGEIVEDGNHQKLIELNGIYASLFNSQAEGYK